MTPVVSVMFSFHVLVYYSLFRQYMALLQVCSSWLPQVHSSKGSSEELAPTDRIESKGTPAGLSLVSWLYRDPALLYISSIERLSGVTVYNTKVALINPIFTIDT